MNLDNLTIKSASQKLNKKEITSVELTEFYLNKIDKLNLAVKAFLTVCKEDAMEAARKADERRANGEKGDLLGIPFVAKDNMLTKGVRTTAGSKILKDYIAPYDATIIRKLKEAGAVLLGKTNLDEFGHGSSTENSAFGTSRNPWDVSRVPGGSSGGSAVAVAADLCVFALGTDTGSSIRQPASFCGVVGCKPTYGRASRYGLIAMASSTDVPGPIAKTAEDSQVVLNAIQGADKYDATSVETPLRDDKKIKIKGLKIGLPKEYFEDGIDEGVKKVIQEAIDEFVRLGAKIVEINLPHTKYAVPVYYIIALSEISSNLARFDGIRYGHKTKDYENLEELYLKNRGEGFGKEAKRRIVIGTYALSSGYYDAYYLRAQKVRTKIVNDFKREFENIDCMLTPVSPHVAFKIGAQSTDPLKMYLEDIFVTAQSLAGLPAVSVPCGFSENMPVGMQIIGKWHDDKKILDIAEEYQNNTAWHEKYPEIS